MKHDSTLSSAAAQVSAKAQALLVLKEMLDDDILTLEEFEVEKAMTLQGVIIPQDQLQALMDLKGLLDNDIITTDEFAQQKQLILDIYNISDTEYNPTYEPESEFESEPESELESELEPSHDFNHAEAVPDPVIPQPPMPLSTPDPNPTSPPIDLHPRSYAKYIWTVIIVGIAVTIIVIIKSSQSRHNYSYPSETEFATTSESNENYYSDTDYIVEEPAVAETESYEVPAYDDSGVCPYDGVPDDELESDYSNANAWE